MLSGAAGVGKTRLAAEACSEAAADGWSVVEVRATPGMQRLPLAVFAPILGAGVFGAEPGQVAAAVDALLTERAEGRPLVLSVDDGHLLDEVSAGFLHHVAASSQTFVIVTVRSREERPEALTSLWKDDLTERLEVQALSRQQCALQVSHLVGGTVDAVTEQRLWGESRGNPLFVRELVLAGLETGNLQEDGGIYRWRGGGGGSGGSAGRLDEVINERMNRLDPEERAAFEFVALAGSVHAPILARLSSEPVIDALERSGLVRVERHDDRREVYASHPIYAEAVRERVPRLRADALYRQLADETERQPTISSGDRIMVALWRLEHGAPVDPETLLTASEAARWSVVSTDLEHMRHALSAGTSDADLAEVEFAWRLGAGDPELAVRLARAAWESDRSSAAGLALAHTFVAFERAQEADDVLNELESLASEPAARARLALGRAALLQHAQGRFAEARDILMRAETEGQGSGDDLVIAILRDVRQARASLELDSGNPVQAVALASIVLSEGVVDIYGVRAAATAAAGMALLGQAEAAIALVDAHIPYAMGFAQESALALGELFFSRAGALLTSGRFREGDTLLRAAYDVALASESHEGAAVYSVTLGRAALLQGLPATALRFFREASAMMADRDALSYAPWALGGIARSIALLGERDTASEMLRDLRAMREEDRYSGDRFFDVDVMLDQHDVLILLGERTQAVTMAEAAVDRARDAGMVVDEAIAHHCLVRSLPSNSNDRATHRDRLADLAALIDNPLTEVLAAHAAGLIDLDGEALERAATTFDGLGAGLLAAEAFADAAHAHGRQGNSRLAVAAGRRAAECAAKCERAQTPALGQLSVPTSLTAREREIALLASTGLTSKEIAGRLVVSVRTVDSHLARIYLKVGVTSRAALAAALATGVTA